MAQFSPYMVTGTVAPRVNRNVKFLLLTNLFLLLFLVTGCAQEGADGSRACFDSNDCALNEACVDDACSCAEGFSDCDGDAANGCEFEGECLCPSLGLTQTCYDGPTDTLGVGTCVAGEQTCTLTGWSDCERQVLPVAESCDSDGLDNNCNGTVDDLPDEDGDGYSACDGDCCDSILEHCAETPALVNPGAYDDPENGVDDDCDGTIDNAPLNDCVEPMTLMQTDAIGLARAMDICNNVNPDGSGWGLMAAEITNADGSSAVNAMQIAVLQQLGGKVDALRNGSMAVLSSGRARGVGDPGFVNGDTSFVAETMDPFETGEGGVQAPTEYVSQHSNSLQTLPECPSGETLVRDSARLRLRLKVPSNAQGIQFKFRFFSYEYPEYLCTEFNDFFLALLDSEHNAIPVDRNISFDAAGNPVSINNAFFTSCEPLECFQGQQDDPGTFDPGNPGDPIPPGGEDLGNGPPASSGADLNMDGCPDSLSCDTATNLCVSQYGACPDTSADVEAYHTDVRRAGATAWLTTSAPVVGGEEILVDFHIWDTSDSSLDSLVLLDHFEWLLEPTEVVTKF
ncbi:MAG: hypothetical protein HOI23_16170 [Deltaproteobacteria bacterium]|nr:hypothetical protein [Deltaproteobacteria bacterium]